MVTIGRLLQEKRQLNGYSLEKMGQLTNIHPKYLSALENNLYHHIPTFYLRAYLRTYGKYLDLDVKSILQHFDKQKMHSDAYKHVKMDEHYAPIINSSRRERYTPLGSNGINTTIPAFIVNGKEPYCGVNNSSLLQQATLPNLNKIDLSLQTLSPRRIAIQTKQNFKKRNKSNYTSFALAIVMSILVGIGLYLVSSEDSNQDSSINSNPIQQDPSIVVNALNTPQLEEGELSDNELLGQIYMISNVNQVDIEIKARYGESTLLYGSSPVNQKKCTLKMGNVFHIKKKDNIWFRLGSPSKVEILVNGQPIKTIAQDTEKSYLIQRKK